jgi:hypothetical protein
MKPGVLSTSEAQSQNRSVKMAGEESTSGLWSVLTLRSAIISHVCTEDLAVRSASSGKQVTANLFSAHKRLLLQVLSC